MLTSLTFYSSTLFCTTVVNSVIRTLHDVLLVSSALNIIHDEVGPMRLKIEMCQGSSRHESQLSAGNNSISLIPVVITDGSTIDEKNSLSIIASTHQLESGWKIHRITDDSSSLVTTTIMSLIVTAVSDVCLSTSAVNIIHDEVLPSFYVKGTLSCFWKGGSKTQHIANYNCIILIPIIITERLYEERI